ncbi:hypothetical protein EXM98_07440 [Clostridium botulinum]|uniref:hypothetical protein n=1 Tax=Clostridium botulinum TaxID=1491 RepID=UPI0005F8C36F|nr:hypothetical protein [Clostridium botulinum]KEI88045.1 hypothetical protein N492_14120 [Clostridium botulinum B2 267]MBY6800528.1 hypothetical protein [Clostridium botulinum]MBY6997751.1 hypothetical protein [Clostridium botulinum]MBY7010009.1 hypothetical protein [Clostridium botulinum]MCR1154695.1 hypothetical protein [Clostridium botulinum]
MGYIVAQYILIIILIIAIGYFLYLIRNKSEDYLEDYYGLSDIIINTDCKDEKSRENIKIILRAIGFSVYEVEKDFKNQSNEIKEDKALEKIEHLLKEYKFKGKINEDTLRYLIRISCALMNETYK